MKKLIILVLVAAIVGGLIWYSKQPKPTSVEALVNGLAAEKGLHAQEGFEIFGKIDSPSKRYTAVLFGPKEDKAPVGILLVQGSLMIKSLVLQSDWTKTKISNLVWADENRVTYDVVTNDSGVIKTEARSLKAN